jgi:hypothetical protein
MFDTNDPHVPTSGGHRHRSKPKSPRTPVIAISLATIAGLVVASQNCSPRPAQPW